MQSKLTKVVFQEYMKLIFHWNQDFVRSVKNSLFKEITENYKFLLSSDDYESIVVSSWLHNDMQDIIDSDEFYWFLESLYDIWIYMILTDPPITLNTTNIQDVVLTIKSNFIRIFIKIISIFYRWKR